MTQDEYTVRIHAEDGGLWAEVVELPGCFASGDDVAELQEALAEAIGVYLSTADSYVRVVIKEFGPRTDESDEVRVLVSA